MTQDVHSGAGDLAPGEQVAGYLIQEQIGRGGMAVVYRALDLRLGRPVALKVLAPHLGQDEAFRQRFIRESRAAAGVDHPHIVPVFEAGQAGDVLFIAMRYVSNGDVRTLIEREGALSPARTIAITSQVAWALDVAHAHGLVHRDVKPGNMLLAQAAGREGDHVYLADFGLSKHSLNASTLTSAGQFLGTLDYVSPEQIQGHPVDGRADQYALACTVVEMLTGAPPFRQDDTMGLMWAQLEAPPPSVAALRPDLPAAIDQVLARALDKSPTARYPTCRAFASALGAACGAGTGLGATAPGRQVRAPAAAVAPRPVRATAHDLPVTAPAMRPPAGRQAAADALRHGEREPVLAAWPARPGGVQSQRRPAGSRRKRKLLAALVVIAVIILAAVGYELAQRGTPARSAAGASESSAGHRSPKATVLAYFAAINDHDYAAAWRLDDRPASFASFQAGYAGTARDSVTIVKTNGNIVTARLVAQQTNGTVKTYKGTYTVDDGVIVGSDVGQVR